MHHAEIIERMSIDDLERCRIMFRFSNDPVVRAALRLIMTELRIRKRRIQDAAITRDLAKFANRNPMVGKQEKEPVMQKDIWYGVKNNQVQFAQDPNALTQAGVNNPRSFSVDGNISGLNLIDVENTGQGSTTGQHTS